MQAINVIATATVFLMQAHTNNGLEHTHRHAHTQTLPTVARDFTALQQLDRDAPSVAGFFPRGRAVVGVREAAHIYI